LTPKATQEQIKTTYFRLSKIYHPDVCRDPKGKEKFVLISKAYETLGNEEKRREYDLRRGILKYPLDERSRNAVSGNFRHEEITKQNANENANTDGKGRKEMNEKTNDHKKSK